MTTIATSPSAAWVLAFSLLALCIFVSGVLAGGRTRTCVPILVISGTYIAVAIVAPILYIYADLPHLDIEDKLFSVQIEYGVTSSTLILAAVSVWAGSAMTGTAFQLFSTGGLDAYKPAPFSRDELRNLIAQIPPAGALAAAIVPVAMYIIGRGPTNLYYSQTYLFSTGPISLQKLGFAAAPFGMLACAILIGVHDRVKTQPVRQVGWGLTAIYALVFFSASSRALALLPIIVTASLLIRPGPLRLFRRLSLGLFFTTYSFSIPLYTRSLTSHGIQPYISEMIQDPGTAFSLNIPKLVGNIFIGYPLSSYVGQLRLPDTALLASLSPLPGGTSGFDDISSSLRINYYIPFSALGELMAYGIVAIVTYFVVAGIALMVGWSFASRQKGPVRLILHVVLIGYSILFAVQSLQYNLRTVTRLEYYILVALGVSFAFNAAFASLTKENVDAPAYS